MYLVVKVRLLQLRGIVSKYVHDLYSARVLEESGHVILSVMILPSDIDECELIIIM